MKGFLWNQCNLLLVLVFVGIGTCGCYEGKVRDDWRIAESNSTSDSIAMPATEGEIGTLYLSDKKWGEDHALLAPFEIPDDIVKKDSFYALMTRPEYFEGGTRQRKIRSYCYFFKVFNSSRDTSVTIILSNRINQTRLFIKPYTIDSLQELHGYNIARSYGCAFKLEISRFKEITLVLNIRSDRTTFSNKLSFWPNSVRKEQKASNSFYLGLGLGLLGFVLASLIYFLLQTKDLVYGLFGIFLVLSFLNLFNLYFPGRVDLDNTVYAVGMIMLYILKYAILLLIPHKKIIWSRSFILLVIVMSAEMLLYSLTIFSNVSFGKNYFVLISVAFAIVYLLYVFEKGHTGIQNKATRTVAVMIISLSVLGMIGGFFSPGIPPSLLFSIIFFLELILFTIALAIRFGSFVKDRRENKVSRAVAQQKEISETIIKTLEDERKRIAQDIHDDLGGTMALLKMEIQGAVTRQDQLQPLLKIIDNASDSLRVISHKLMPPYFAETGLDTSLSEHFKQLNSKGGMQFHLYYSGDPPTLTKEDELMIYRIIMELTHNCLKHSKAHEVTLQFTYNKFELEILCEDDGVGFSANDLSGIGLKNIKSRVSYLNGTITIDTSSRGTTIIIHLPFRATSV